MKLLFSYHRDGQLHSYCLRCHSERVERCRVEGRTQYYCHDCRQLSDRWIKLDPGLQWWLDGDGEYWHESSGVFVCDGAGRFLLFQRSVFPFALTVPAGHVDVGEAPERTAGRELLEEVGLSGNLTPVITADIVGDSCSLGADAHRWHAYRLAVAACPAITVREEGSDPLWLTADQALQRQLTPPVRYMLERHRGALSV